MLTNIVFSQVPHAFQQILSAEKTPCISDTLPTFEAMRSTWDALQEELLHLSEIIDASLDKLAEYCNHADDVDVLFLAISKPLSFL